MNVQLSDPAVVPKRILILVENLPVPFDRRVWMQATTLQQAGYHVTVICPCGDYPRGREVLDGVTIYRYWLPSLSGILGHFAEYAWALAMTFVLTCVVRWREGFDVIQSANPPDIFFLIARLFRPIGTRFVFDQHDVMPEICESRWRGWRQTLMKRFCLWTEWATYRTADFVVANNESYRAIALGRGGMAPARVTVVRNAPRLNRFRAVAPRAELRQAGHSLIAYLGVIGPNDGLDLLLQALSHIVHTRGRNDVRCVIIGSGDLFQETVGLSHALRLDDYVRFTGRIPDNEVIDWLSSADVCVAPDPKDPLNDISSFNKIVEYMAIGKPIVAFDLAEVRISAGDAAVYVEPNDTQRFGDAVLGLIDAPARRASMGRAGRERFETELAWEHQVPPLLAMYKALFGQAA